MIKALIVELDGVVTYTDAAQLHREFAEKAGIEPDKVAAYVGAHQEEMLLGEVGFDRFLQEVGGGEKSETDLKWIWIEAMQKARSVNEDLLAILDILREDVKVVALSNLTEAQHVANQEAGLYEHFDATFLSCEKGMKKPDPRFFQLALDELGIAASEAAYVDEQLGFVTAATVLGMHGLVYGENDRLREELGGLGIAI